MPEPMISDSLREVLSGFQKELNGRGLSYVLAVQEEGTGIYTAIHGNEYVYCFLAHHLVRCMEQSLEQKAAPRLVEHTVEGVADE